MASSRSTRSQTRPAKPRPRSTHTGSLAGRCGHPFSKPLHPAPSLTPSSSDLSAAKTAASQRAKPSASCTPQSSRGTPQPPGSPRTNTTSSYPLFIAQPTTRPTRSRAPAGARRWRSAQPTEGAGRATGPGRSRGEGKRHNGPRARGIRPGRWDQRSGTAARWAAWGKSWARSGGTRRHRGRGVWTAAAARPAPIRSPMGTPVGQTVSQARQSRQ